jgi:uroporphyrinogen-III synthase
MEQPLKGRRIALAETRELDRLALMLETAGAETVRCPLVAIRDTPDEAPVRAWIERFVAAPPEDLVLLTGEGLRRLAGFAERWGMRDAFVAALGRTRTVTRGPKPARALRELGSQPGLRAPEPTTGGVIAVLAGAELRGHRVGVQLYPGNPNDQLLGSLRDKGAEPDPVLPYVYASAAEDARVAALIDELAEGGIDAIAFTSSPQVSRLFEVAEASGRGPALAAGLRRTAVAAIGPVVAAALARRGVQPSITPDGAYFMKPLVSAIAAAFSKAGSGGG